MSSFLYLHPLIMKLNPQTGQCLMSQPYSVMGLEDLCCPQSVPPKSLKMVLLSLTVHWPLLSYRYGDSWHSPDGQRRCAFIPASSSSSGYPSTSSLPSSSFASSSPSSYYSPGCRVRQVASSPAQPQSSRGHRLSKVSFSKGSS